MLPSGPIFTPFFLARRNMRRRRGRTLLTLLGIILGVSVVLAVQVTNETTLDSLRQVFDRATGYASLLVVPIKEGDQSLEDSLLPSLQARDGILAASPTLINPTLLASEMASWEIAFNMSGIAAGNMLHLYGIDPQIDPQVRIYVVISGALPQTGKYQAAIPQAFALQYELELGDNLEILTPGGSARLKIVGLLADEGVGLLNGSAVAFTSLDIAQELFERPGEVDEIALKVDPVISGDSRRLEAFKEALSRRVGKDAQVIYPAARGELVSQMLTTYQLGLAFFSIIAICVGAFLIYNAFSMTVVERTREIGMLRAIGMDRFKVVAMVIAEASLLSAAGSLFGLGAGLLLSRGLITLLGDLVAAQNGASGLRIPQAGLLQSLAVGIGVTLLAALLPALQAARISPLEALRARSRSVERIHPVVWLSGLVFLLVGYLTVYQFKWPGGMVFQVGVFALLSIFLGATLTVTLAVSGLERLARPLARLVYGNEGSIGSSNVRRAIGRTTLTVASLMVALTMVIGIASVAFSFRQDMNNWVDNALGGDLYVRSPVPMRESFAGQLSRVPGVQVVSPSRYLLVRAAPGRLQSDNGVDENFYFVAIDPTTFRQIGDFEFAANQGESQANWQRLVQGKAVFISNVIADRYRLGQEDELWLLTSRGEQAFAIAAVVMDFGGGGQVAYGLYDDLHRWFSRQGVDRFTISAKPGYSVPAVGEEIERRYQDRKHITVQTIESFKQSILGLMEQSFRLFDVLNLIGVIIGVLGVINTLTMNVIERQREIGGLRSLGMTRPQVLRMILAESLALGVIGGAYGLLVGYAIAHVMILGVNMMVGYDLRYLFTPDPFLTGAFIALVVVQLAALLPARRAARVNIVEAVKHE